MNFSVSPTGQFLTASESSVVKLLAELVNHESFSGEERDVQTFIQQWFEDRDIAAVLEDADGGLKNLVVEVIGNGEGPVLWIGGHCDTVGIASDWTRAPHRACIEGDRLYGLGSMDMKAGLAAAMMTVHKLHVMREQWGGKLIFAALADEEAWSRGASAFVRTDRHIDAAIMCEPHFDDIVIGAMGKVNLYVTVKGMSAHGSTPECGINAITEAAKFLVALECVERYSHPEFGKASHCLLNISSGNGRYEIRVPDHCQFRINWQFMPGETVKGTLEKFNQLIASLDSPAKFSIEVGEPRYESYLIEQDCPVVLQLIESYRELVGKEPELRFGKGVSDANIFTGRAGIPTILFGPGGANMHSGDEWVSLTQLEKTCQIYLNFAMRFFTNPEEKAEL